MASRQPFQAELSGLKHDLLKMGIWVTDAIEKAVQSLTRSDINLAHSVVDGDDTADAMLIDIEKRCLNLIPLQQPMASDLRTIGAALKIVTDLERMADHAVDIAKVTIELNREPLLKELVDIPRMAQRVQAMIREALEAYVARDVARARSMIAMDDEIDCIYHDLSDELLGMMQVRPQTVRQATHLLMVAMYLERVGDHATNLGEWTIYMVTGDLQDLNA